MIPNDCIVVQPKEGVSPFTHLTWNSHGCPKTIPLDIYELNKYRLVVMDDPHNLLPKTEAPVPEEPKKVDFVKEAKDVTNAILDGDMAKATAEANDLMKKVKKVGKSKNKKW